MKKTKTNKTKNFWSKLEYWQMGGVITTIILLVLITINDKIKLFPPRLTSSLLLVIIMLLLSFLYGSILGQLYKYLKNKKWSYYLKWLVFIIILGILTPLFYYVLVVTSLIFYYG